MTIFTCSIHRVFSTKITEMTSTTDSIYCENTTYTIYQMKNGNKLKDSPERIFDLLIRLLWSLGASKTTIKAVVALLPEPSAAMEVDGVDIQDNGGPQSRRGRDIAESVGDERTREVTPEHRKVVSLCIIATIHPTPRSLFSTRTSICASSFKIG